MKSGTAVGGCWLGLFSSIAAEIVAQAGYDCVMIDLEHGPGSILDAVPLMQAVKSSGCASLLRVPANDPVWIKKALDAGVDGVMVPGVDGAAEAALALAACRYPPRGIRGMATAIVRASDYGAREREYLESVDEELLVICQVESPQAVEEVADIAAVDGLDMLFVGPMDLSTSLGHLGEPDHPEVLSRITRVEAAAKAAGKLLGGIPTPARPPAALFEAGYSLVLADFDLLMLRDGARAGAAALRRAAGGG
jgi:2-keto-3-deoxy-L-rhamnonate aldolase RhmA